MSSPSPAVTANAGETAISPSTISTPNVTAADPGPSSVPKNNPSFTRTNETKLPKNEIQNLRRVTVEVEHVMYMIPELQQEPNPTYQGRCFVVLRVVFHLKKDGLGAASLPFGLIARLGEGTEGLGEIEYSPQNEYIKDGKITWENESERNLHPTASGGGVSVDLGGLKWHKSTHGETDVVYEMKGVLSYPEETCQLKWEISNRAGDLNCPTTARMVFLVRAKKVPPSGYFPFDLRIEETLEVDTIKPGFFDHFIYRVWRKPPPDGWTFKIRGNYLATEASHVWEAYCESKAGSETSFHIGFPIHPRPNSSGAAPVPPPTS